MAENRVSVFSTNQLFEAEILRHMLQDNGIQVFLLNQMDNAYHFGDIELLVLRDDVIRSKKLIEEFQNR